MKCYGIQRNITITQQQQEFLKENHGRVNISVLSKMLGLTYNKVHKNLRMMGFVKTRERSAKVIQMDSSYFNIDDFQRKYYKY